MTDTLQRPTHGLGVDIPEGLTPEEIAHKAGIDWTVSKRPLLTTQRYADGEDYAVGDETIEVPDRVALVRDTDNRPLTVVGRGWHPVQNIDAVRFFHEFAEAGGSRVTEVGSLRGGTIVWGTADLGESFSVGSHDEVRGYLLLLSPHIAGRSVMARVLSRRFACENQLAAITRTSQALERRWSHVREFDPKIAAEAMGIVRREFADFGKLAKQLSKLRMSEQQVHDLLRGIIMGEADDREDSRTMVAVMDSYHNAPGADPGTGWGVLNAITHHADHVAGRNPDGRLTSSWIGGAADRKRKVLAQLTELVNA